MHLYLRRRSAWRPSIAASILFVSAEAVPGVVVQRVDRHRRAVARQALVEVLVREALVAAERVRAELQRALEVRELVLLLQAEAVADDAPGVRAQPVRGHQ